MRAFAQEHGSRHAAHGYDRLIMFMDFDRDRLASTRRRQLFGALAVTALVGVVAAPVVTHTRQPVAVPERRVKAAFLYKFLGYTEFPASAFADAGSPVVIGVIGAYELGAELGRIVAGRTVQSRPIVVKVMRDAEGACAVHMLFLGGNDNARIRSVIRAAAPGPMLVVSETEDGLQQGSVINFRVVDERVRFDVSLEAAEKNSVKLSSRLLAVANYVQRERRDATR